MLKRLSEIIHLDISIKPAIFTEAKKLFLIATIVLNVLLKELSDALNVQVLGKQGALAVVAQVIQPTHQMFKQVKVLVYKPISVLALVAGEVVNVTAVIVVEVAESLALVVKVISTSRKYPLLLQQQSLLICPFIMEKIHRLI